MKAEAFKFKKAVGNSAAELDLEQIRSGFIEPDPTLDDSFVVPSKRFAGAKSNRGPPSL